MPKRPSGLESISWISDRNKIYLNWAGAERVRQDVAAAEDRFRKWQHLYEDDPKACMSALQSAITDSREKISKLVGCSNPTHIFFTTGSEESLKDVLFAHQLIPWGSRILATDCEFFGTYSKITAPRYLTDIARIFDKRSDKEIVKEVIGSLRSDTRLILISHVCYNSGFALPVAEICAKAKSKNPDILVLVDGAQAVGQIPVDVAALGCDFYAGDGHKWLVGPDQTGFLYVRSSEHLEVIAKDLSSAFAVHPELNHDKGSRSGAIAFELAALGETLQPFLNGDTLHKTQLQAQSLAGLFRRLVAEELSEYYRVLPQSQSNLPTAIVSLAAANNKSSLAALEKIHDDLLDAGIHCAIIKRIPTEFADEIRIPPLLRFCFHVWNSKAEVETVVKTLMLIAKKRDLRKAM